MNIFLVTLKYTEENYDGAAVVGAYETQEQAERELFAYLKRLGVDEYAKGAVFGTGDLFAVDFEFEATEIITYKRLKISDITVGNPAGWSFADPEANSA